MVHGTIYYKYHIEGLDDRLWLGRNISHMEMLGFVYCPNPCSLW